MRFMFFNNVYFYHLESRQLVKVIRQNPHGDLYLRKFHINDIEIAAKILKAFPGKVFILKVVFDQKVNQQVRSLLTLSMSESCYNVHTLTLVGFFVPNFIGAYGEYSFSVVFQNMLSFTLKECCIPPFELESLISVHVLKIVHPPVFCMIESSPSINLPNLLEFKLEFEKEYRHKPNLSANHIPLNMKMPTVTDLTCIDPNSTILTEHVILKLSARWDNVI